MVRRWLLLASAVAAVSASAFAATTGAAFTKQKSNAGNAFAAASNFCPLAGTQTYRASGDAKLEQGPNGDTNYGSANRLEIRSASLLLGLGPRNERSVLTFSLPSLGSFCEVTGATLTLKVETATTGRTLLAQRVTGSWTENGVTWNNQPSTTTSHQASTSSSNTDDVWNVTSLVQDIYSSGQNNGMLVRDQSENTSLGSLVGAPTQVLFSRDVATESDRPKLEVTFD
jgi:hypothetical protein